MRLSKSSVFILKDQLRWPRVGTWASPPHALVPSGQVDGVKVVSDADAHRPRQVVVAIDKGVSGEELVGRGWNPVTVDPALPNLRAIRAWEKAGFASDGEWPDHPDGPALRMVFRG